MPFPTAFLVMEARTRGFWPFQPDRDMKFQKAQTVAGLEISPSSSGGSGGTERLNHLSGGSGSGGAEDSDGGGGGAWSSTGAAFDGNDTIRLSNPFENPKELEKLVAGYRKLPNWKAAIIEGTSWAGTAEENIALYNNEILPELGFDQWYVI